MCRGEPSAVMTQLVSKCLEAGGNGREELAYPFPFRPLIRECQVKENPDRKKYVYQIICRHQEAQYDQTKSPFVIARAYLFDSPDN